MRSVLAGTLGLIVLYAVLQPRASQGVDQASNWFVDALRRISDPVVAGVPLRNTGGEGGGGADATFAVAPAPAPAPGIWT